MAAEMQAVAQLLQATLDPRQHKQAEQALKAKESTPKFSLLLLEIVNTSELPLSTRLASALCFKNFIRFNYVDEERNYKLPLAEVMTIKQVLISLMISAPPSVRAQLGEAISLIADSDFWDRWDTLVDDLVSQLSPDNPNVNNGVLEVAHSIFRRWRPLFASDELYEEINHVLGKFGEPFVKLLISTDAQIKTNKDNKDILRQHFMTMDLLVQLFFDLSCQDLPPIFEENLQPITELLLSYLEYDNALLRTEDDSEVGPIETVKTGICEALVLYVQKYEDAFGPLLPPFITKVWGLLTTTGQETKYDLLVSKALHFLTAVSGIRVHAENFNNESVLQQIVENAILPNVSLRESDVEQFEDEPIEYIRKNLEGTDIDTRRRAATEFLRRLLLQFEALVTEVVKKYINHYMGKFAANPKDEWKSKDAAVYLWSAIVARGAVTTAHGVRETTAGLDVVQFFEDNIAIDLIEKGAEPILTVDAINYLYTFRSQFTHQQWQKAFPPLVQNLASSNYVVYTYAAIAVERVLTLTDSSQKHIFGKEQVEPYANDLLSHLFQLIERDGAPEKIQENEFLMRCVMRILIVIKEGIIPFATPVLQHLINITQAIAKNPSNPRFYYYHFEALGALIRYVAPSQPEQLEQALYEPFAGVLHNDVEEFKPYVFQLFAALLEAHPYGDLSEYYKALIAPILMHDLWTSRGNIPALSRLLCSIIPRAAAHITANNQVEPILGVFQNLVSKKAKTEAYAFDILESIIMTFDAGALSSYFSNILQLIYGRLNSPTVTEAFKMRFARFYHLTSALKEPRRGYGCDYFIAASDKVQDGVFVPIYKTIILPTTQQLAKPLDRKLAAISLTKSIASSEKFASKYVLGWTLTCEALIKLLETAPTLAADDNMVVEQDVDDISFGVGFTQLNSCKRQPTDLWPEIVNIKSWVGKFYSENGKKDYLTQRLSGDMQMVFASYQG